MLEAGIAQLLINNANVQISLGALGNPARVYPVVLPENPTYPCATYQVISDVPDYLLSGSAAMEVKRIQIDTWSGGPTGASYLAAKNAQVAIREALELFRGTLPDGTVVGGIFVAHSADLYEQDARAYRTTTDFMVHYYPAT